MATITVRSLSTDGEPQYGNGTQNFISDLAAVSQIIRSTLLLLKGEMFLALNAGTPLFQALVGQAITNQAVALIYQSIILGVPYVTGIASVSVVYVPQSRQYSFSALVSTVFGTIPIEYLLLAG